MFTDFDVKYAVEILANWCSSNDRLRKKNGVRILKKARLTAFIPNTSRGYLKEYRENPERMLSEVKLRVSKLKEVLPQKSEIGP